MPVLVCQQRQLGAWHTSMPVCQEKGGVAEELAYWYEVCQRSRAWHTFALNGQLAYSLGHPYESLLGCLGAPNRPTAQPPKTQNATGLGVWGCRASGLRFEAGLST